jgi:uncharacterized protein
MSNLENKPAPAPRKIPNPRILPESEAYWSAANESKLLIKKCQSCNQFHFYPRDICPHCMSSDTVWEKAQGTGTVYSFSTMGKGEAAYTMALITLDEGVTMMSNLVECDPRDVRIGQKVQVIFKPSENGQAVPMFQALPVPLAR